MADISIEQIKKLKELSGAGLTDAKQALVEAEGDTLSPKQKYSLSQGVKCEGKNLCYFY